MIFYNLRTAPGGYLLTKFIDDGITFDVDVVYIITRPTHPKANWLCTCPSRFRPCKHLTSIIPRFKAEAKIDTEWFLGEDNHFYRPIPDPTIDAPITAPVIPAHYGRSPAVIYSPTVEELKAAARPFLDSLPPLPTKPWRRL